MSTIDKNHPLIVCRASAGTGKTFTLAAYYIAMLLSGESYRNILAVTFTNAATAEMKERIISYLLRLAQGGEKDFLQVVRQYMLRDEDKGDEVLRARAEANMHAILQDYDNFSVTTIDSFLQQLIRGMAKAINRTADFTISLDPEQVITNAVDTMLTSELTDSSKRTIYEYVEQCIGESKGWDIRDNLIHIAMQLYRESVQVYNTRLAAERHLDLDEQRISNYRKALHAQQHAAIAALVKMTNQVKHDMECGVAYAQGGFVKVAVTNILKSAADPKSINSKADIFRGATEKGMGDMLCEPPLRALQQACDDTRHVYWQTIYSLAYLNDMRLMRALDDSIHRSLLRTNTALLAETAATLAEALRPGDADFILEKAGVRYRHIMIDEFQDTSLLQWNVFMHLIREIVAAPEQTILIVGDTKQSIYRFRNGNWQIMEGLGRTELREPFNPNVAPLIRNQRSREKVVAFNLGVMQQVAEQPNLQIPVSATDPRPIGAALYDEQQAQLPLSNFYRTDKHQGGYVRCRFYPFYDAKAANKLGTDRVKETMLQALWDDVCATIEQLLQAGEQAHDILVLARFNNEIQQWVTYCREQGNRFPLLNRTQMVSRDSFKLESCASTLLMIEALRYIHTGSQAAAEFIRIHRENQIIERIESIDKSAPLYDQLQHLLQKLFCEQGSYRGEDVAYINCLLDQVQQFVAVNGSDVPALLQYWQDKMHESAITGDSSSEAIRLMSVHSSKGLEGKTVILLNAAWKTEHDRADDILWSEAMHLPENSLPLIPIKQEANLQLTGEQSLYYRAYRLEHEAQLIDNYNLLYVALTRAADNLYVYALTDVKKHLDGYPTVAASLMDYTRLRNTLQDVAEQEQLYSEFTSGDQPYIHSEEARRADGPFEFAGATSVPAHIYSDGGQIHFRQSQESTQYMLEQDNAEQANSQTDFGLLCHDIFAHIAHAEEAEQVLDSYRRQGLIEDNETYNRIADLIRCAFTSEQMQQWFDGTWQLMREASILTPAGLIRPDRVMIKGDTAVVLDYKFTDNQRPGYIYQVSDYMRALKDMGFAHVEGWLWYAFSNQTVQVLDH